MHRDLSTDSEKTCAHAARNHDQIAYALNGYTYVDRCLLCWFGLIGRRIRMGSLAVDEISYNQASLSLSLQSDNEAASVPCFLFVCLKNIYVVCLLVTEEDAACVNHLLFVGTREAELFAFSFSVLHLSSSLCYGMAT